MEIKDKLDLDQNGTPLDATKYRSMIGVLMYLTSSRPDIVHATCDSGFELTGFLDADYAGCKDTFKSTSSGAQFLAISISCNPVQHSRTKHIAVRYHFIKEHVEKGTVELYFVKTDYQLADIFTKALPIDRFNYLVHRLSMRSLSPKDLDHLAKSQVILFSIHSDEWKSFHSQHQTALRDGNDKVITRTKIPVDVPISSKEPKRIVNQSVATPLRRTVASESTNQKPRNTTCVPLYQILHCLLILLQLVEIILFIIDSGCSKHMTGNLKLLINFVEKFLGTVKFRNDQIAHILGYGDLVQGAVIIKRVYYVKGLNHNLLSVGQLCDADLEVAFQKSTCYIRDLKGNDLLISSRGTDLYSITLQDTSSPNPICLMAKATSSQAWYTWTHFLRSKNKTPEVLIDFLRLVQRGLNAQVRSVRTNNGTEFLNKTLNAYFAAEGINHQTDGENLDKIKEKGNACIFVGYSTQSRAYRVFSKRTRVILETIHVNFDELPHMASDHVSSDPVPQCQRTTLEHDSLSPDPQCQDNVPHAAVTVTTSNELDLLFSLMFDELLNGSTQVVSKTSAKTTADAPNQCQQQHTTPLNTQITPEPTC
nr:retrotransposon protein, putative, unclassified [Tanacetum cinerariifolium]